MKDWIKAYTAAFIDGEGCMYRDKKTNLLRIQVVQVDIKPLNFLKATWGGSLHFYSKKKYPRWTLTGRQAEHLIREVTDFFIVKKDKADSLVPY